jgi:hypothetical protein
MKMLPFGLFANNFGYKPHVIASTAKLTLKHFFGSLILFFGIERMVVHLSREKVQRRDLKF